MSYRTRFLIKGAAAIAVLWIVVAVVVKVAGSMAPTSKRLLAYVASHPLGEIDNPERRREVISRVAELMNQLEPSELRDFEENTDPAARREFFQSMTREEQWFFLEQRLGRAFSQMMKLFNEMEREERKEMVERALSRIRENAEETLEGEPDLLREDPDLAEKVAEAGLEAYYQDASAETKMDLAPLMEEVQRIMSQPRRGQR